ncbi:MAG: hypothetical protein AB1810_13725 [Pseudomonadota bacterium]
MSDIEIPRDQWPEYCQSFSLGHHGWLVNVLQVETRRLAEIRDSAIAAGRVLAAERPLQEVRETEHGDEVEIVVTVGRGTDEASFLVKNVRGLLQEQTAEAQLGLRVDSADKTSLLVEFRVAAKPETLDGLAASERQTD